MVLDVFQEKVLGDCFGVLWEKYLFCKRMFTALGGYRQIVNLLYI